MKARRQKVPQSGRKRGRPLGSKNKRKTATPFRSRTPSPTQSARPGTDDISSSDDVGFNADNNDVTYHDTVKRRGRPLGSKNKGKSIATPRLPTASGGRTDTVCGGRPRAPRERQDTDDISSLDADYDDTVQNRGRPLGPKNKGKCISRTRWALPSESRSRTPSPTRSETPGSHFSSSDDLGFDADYHDADVNAAVKRRGRPSGSKTKGKSIAHPPRLAAALEGRSETVLERHSRSRMPSTHTDNQSSSEEFDFDVIWRKKPHNQIQPFTPMQLPVSEENSSDECAPTARRKRQTKKNVQKDFIY